METRRTIHKWFWVWDFEKEDDWLNEMALNGWVLESVGYATYHFVRCEPGEYSVRTEMHPADEDYVQFILPSLIRKQRKNGTGRRSWNRTTR